MRLAFLPLAAALVAGPAGADPFTDAVVKNLRDLGYQYIEIQRGATQLKAEAVRGTEEFEVIYDLATGHILKQERGRADAEYIGRTGLEISARNRDFLGDDDDDDDDDDDRSGRRGGDDDDDDDRSGRGGGDDRSGGSRDDDDHDDDRGGSSGRGSGDDDDDD